MRKLTAALCTAAILIGAPATAQAADPEPFELRISYEGLDLTDEADFNRLRSRIRIAVREACVLVGSDGLIDRVCFAVTMQSAMEALEERPTHYRRLAAA